MSQPEETQEIEVGFDGKPLKPAKFATGQSHLVSFKFPVLLLDFRYHDDVPVAGAEYEVELADGTFLHGRLLSAKLSSMPALG